MEQPNTSVKKVNFSFEGKALPLFGYLFLSMLLAYLVIPAGWGLVLLMVWYVSKIKASDDSIFTFSGKFGQIALVASLNGALALGYFIYSRSHHPFGTMALVYVLYYLVSATIATYFIRWTIANLEYNNVKRFKFEGSYWSVIGWMMLIYFFIFSIIGWAWVTVAYFRWLCSKTIDIEGSGIVWKFQAKGITYLWRTICLIIFCLPVISIPWAILWYYKWFISQCELEVPETIQTDVIEADPVIEESLQ